MNPKISLIIPYYNAKEYIASTIDCLHAQTFQEFLAIFVDDGSMDGTSEYIEEYLKDVHFPYQIIRCPHRGVSAARNKGLDIVKTDYVMFLDSDDLIEPMMLQDMISEILRSESDIVYCEYSHRRFGRTAWTFRNSFHINHPVQDGLSTLNDIFDYRLHIITQLSHLENQCKTNCGAGLGSAD